MNQWNPRNQSFIFKTITIFLLNSLVNIFVHTRETCMRRNALQKNKTYKGSSLQINLISVRFYEMGDRLRQLMTRGKRDSL